MLVLDLPNQSQKCFFVLDISSKLPRKAQFKIKQEAREDVVGKNFDHFLNIFCQI